MSDDSKDIKIGGISASEYVRGIKHGNIDPSFDNAVKAILWAADEIERLRGVVDEAPAGVELIDRIAQWLHDETDHPYSYPDYTWPETDRDDGQREGGFVKMVPQHALAYFRDIARRLIAGFGYGREGLMP